MRMRDFQEIIKTIPIIDFHAHPFYDLSEHHNHYGMACDREGFRRRLEDIGIRAVCGSIISAVPEGEDAFKAIRELNRHALLLRDAYDGFYVPGIHIHPAFPRESCEELERYRAQGVRLVGELVPYMMGWSRYAEKGAYEIFERAQSLDMVLSLHPSTAEDMEELAAAFPRLNIVFAHPGERSAYFEHIARMKRHDNVYLDLCGTGLFRDGMLRYGIRELGAERLLFGTDFPICNPAMQIYGVLFETDDARECALIFHDNAARLLHLSQP